MALSLLLISMTKLGASVFDREAIGVKRYQATFVVVVRCFNRLVARGLAEREYNRGIRQGVRLTDVGVKVAREIKSN